MRDILDKNQREAFHAGLRDFPGRRERGSLLSSFFWGEKIFWRGSGRLVTEGEGKTRGEGEIPERGVASCER